MALSEDQRAMLRLLAQREQGYDDIAALMGLSVDEVRARVAEALAELERERAEEAATPPPEPEPPAAEPEPSPPAEPPTPAEPVPVPPAEPAPRPEAASPVGAATKDRKTPDPAPAAGRPRLSVPRDPGARAAIAVGVVVLIGLVVVLVVGGGGDGDSTSGAGGPAADGQQSAANGEGTEPTEAILEPVGGGGASGKATFGNLDESLAMLVEAEGLEPTGNGQSYAIWLAESPKRMVPVGEIELQAGEELSTQVPLPVELLAFIADETFTEVALTRANSSRLEKSVRKATEDKKAPAYTGETVLRGDVTGPIVGAELPAAESGGEAEGGE